MNLRTIILSILVLFLLGFSINNAQPGRRFGKGRCRLIDKLNLTEEQTESINNYRFEHKESVIELRSKLAQNRLEIDKLLAEKEIDQNRILELSKAGNELKGQIQESRIRMWLNIYNTFDDTQKQIWRESRPRFGKFAQRMRGMRHRGGFDGEGFGRMRQNREFDPGRLNPN